MVVKETEFAELFVDHLHRVFRYRQTLCVSNRRYFTVVITWYLHVCGKVTQINYMHMHMHMSCMYMGHKIT